MSTAFRISHAERNFGASFRQHHASSDTSKDEVDRFKNLFANTTRECSPANIQACTSWIIDNVLPSPALVDAFGGFVASVSAAYSAEKQKKDGISKAEVKANLWAIIFLINELLHTTKHGQKDRHQYDDCTSSLRLPIINLLKDLAQFPRQAHRKHFKRLLGLLALWHRQGYFDKAYIESLKTIVDSEGQSLPNESKDFSLQKHKRGSGDADQPRKRKKTDPTKGIQILGSINNVQEDGDWKLPEWHGGENTAWHLLPAASWLKALRQTDHEDGRGMSKRDVKALQFRGDGVSSQVRKEVLRLLKQADEIYNPGPDNAKRIEYDQLGRKMEVIKVQKGADGKVRKFIKCDTYYGWSSKFLNEMYKNPEEGFLKEIRLQRRRRSTSPISRRSNSPSSRRSTPPLMTAAVGSSAAVHPSATQSTPLRPSYQAPKGLDAAYTGIPQSLPNFSIPPPLPPPAFMQGQSFPPRPTGWNGPWPPPPPPPPPPPLQMMGQQPPMFPQQMMAQFPQQPGWPQMPQPPSAGPGQGFQNGYNNGFGQQQQQRGNLRGGFNNRGGYGSGF